MRFHPIAGAAVLAVLSFSSAQAAVTVIGNGLAQACSDAAMRERADQVSFAACNMALSDETLDLHDLSGTFVNRGILEMIQGDFGPARMDFDHAIGIQPKLGAAWANRGAVNLAQGRYQDALDDLNKALAFGVDHLEKVYFNRALAYEGLDDERSAYFDYQQATTLAPNWDLPKKELARFTVTPQ